MFHFDTFGKRCRVDTVGLVSFLLAFLYYRGWKATRLDVPAFPEPRGGHVLAKKIPEKVPRKGSPPELKTKACYEKTLAAFCLFTHSPSSCLEYGCDVGCVAAILGPRGDKHELSTMK